MARQPSEPKRAILTAEQMRHAIPRIKSRIQELEALDPNQMSRRDDPVLSGVEDRVNQTLADVFGPDTVDYQRFNVMLDTAGYNLAYETPRNEWIQGYKDGIEDAVGKMNSILVLFDERLAAADTLPVPARPQGTDATRKVFVVHGHDDRSKLQVARFLDQLELSPIILHEELNRGQTIIEKFERHANEARFAIVLLTPDDEGYPAGRRHEAQPRARQNVILELGFFAAKLGRQHVVALNKGVEMPSDLHGVLYEPMDDRGHWKLRLAKEIRAAGIEIDMNKL